MAHKSLQDLVEGLTPKERLQFKDLIAELLQNEVEIMTSKENSNKLLKELHSSLENILCNLEKCQESKHHISEKGLVDYMTNLPAHCFHKV